MFAERRNCAHLLGNVVFISFILNVINVNDPPVSYSDSFILNEDNDIIFAGNGYCFTPYSFLVKMGNGLENRLEHRMENMWEIDGK